MNTIIKHPHFETCLSLLIVAFATVSISFGMCWSLYASVMLHV